MIDVTEPIEEAYNSCFNMNKCIVDTGVPMVEKLKAIITGLKENWQSSDGAMHINKIVKLHNALDEMVQNTKYNTALAANAIVQLQEVIQSNGGVVNNLGTYLSTEEPVLIRVDEVVGSTGYHFVKENADTSKSDLNTVMETFSAFLTTFKSNAQDLETRWKAGMNREKAMESIESFKLAADGFEKDLSFVYEQYSKAVANSSLVSD